MLLIESQYFPNIAWMQSFATSNKVMVEHFDFYQKQSLRNRCRILGAEKTILLSVPLLGGRNQKTVMKDIRIDNTQRWQQDHRKAIQSCYAKSPFYEYYSDVVIDLISKPTVFLVDLNLSIIEQCARWLKWEGELKTTDKYMDIDNFAIDMVDQRDVTRSKGNNQPYIQVFNDRHVFCDGLSFLDALFCMGPNLKNYLQYQAA